MTLETLDASAYRRAPGPVRARAASFPVNAPPLIGEPARSCLVAAAPLEPLGGVAWWLGLV